MIKLGNHIFTFFLNGKIGAHIRSATPINIATKGGLFNAASLGKKAVLYASFIKVLSYSHIYLNLIVDSW